MNIVLVVGSPKGVKSTSNSVIKYLSDRLEDLGVTTQTFFVNALIRKPETMQEFLSASKTADTLVLSAPLYNDCQPGSVVKFMEEFSGSWVAEGTDLRFAAIFNNGFPEGEHNDVALEICEAFASTNSLEWVGGLSYAGGQAVDGVDLTLMGGAARFIKPALNLVAGALSTGESIPVEAMALSRKYVTPKWLFGFLGKRFWKSKVKKYGTQKRLNDRPYAP